MKVATLELVLFC